MTVYFDNAATTRVRPEAAEKALEVMMSAYGNPSSTHALGREAKAVLDTARKHVAAAMGAQPGEVFFTSGGTEADNWAITMGAWQMRHRGRHVITTQIEHDAVRRSAARLEEQGYTVTYIAPNAAGRVTPEAVAAALREDTVLVSVMLVNNETGAVNDVAGIAALLRERGSAALLHTDAVQALGKVPFSAAKLGADLISVSGHKIQAPKGAGVLYVRKGLRLPGLLLGGGQEESRRGGTEALPAIAAFGEAARLAKAEFAETAAHLRALRDRTAAALAEIPGLRLIGEGDAPHILSLSLPGYRSEVLLNWLDAAGICVSRSSACKKGARSHVLEAMRLPPEVIDGAIRVSFCRDNTAEEVDFFAEKLREARATLRPALR